MTRKMTKREIRRYEERLSKEANNQDPNRNRKLVKVLGVYSANWAQHTGLFTEKVKIVDIKFYDKEKSKLSEDELRKNDFLNNDNNLCVLVLDYGKIEYGYLFGDGYIKHEEYIDDTIIGLVPVCCKVEDIKEYNVGDEITIYVEWSRGYDGTGIYLSLYNRWEKRVPTITNDSILGSLLELLF